MSTAGPISPFFPSLLRGHVARRADDHAALRLTQLGFQVDLLGQAEVADLGDPVGGQKYVGGLQVAVDDLLRLGMLHGAGQRGDQFRGEPSRLRLPRQFLIQAPPRDIFLDDISLTLMRPGVEDLHDIRVLEPSQGRGFRVEPSSLDRRTRQLGLEELQGHPAVEPDLLRKVNDPHPAPSAFAQDDEPR